MLSVIAPISNKTRLAFAPVAKNLLPRLLQEDAGEDPIEPKALRAAACFQILAECVLDRLTTLAEFAECFVPLTILVQSQGEFHVRCRRSGGIDLRTGHAASGPLDTPRRGDASPKRGRSPANFGKYSCHCSGNGHSKRRLKYIGTDFGHAAKFAVAGMRFNLPVKGSRERGKMHSAKIVTSRYQ